MNLLCRSLLRISVLCATLLLTTVVTHAHTVLQGSVTNRNTGAPLVGVRVGACGATFTDGNGNYSLTAEDLCNRSSGGVSFIKTGYFFLSVPYTLTASPTILDTTLLAGGTILQGMVTDASTQAAIAGANIEICIGGGSST